MDITNFMEWFFDNMLDMMVFIYDTLNSITFGGTSLLKVILFINLIVPFLYLVISTSIGADTVERANESTKELKNKIRQHNTHVQYANQLKQLYANYPDERRWIYDQYKNDIGGSIQDDL